MRDTVGIRAVCIAAVTVIALSSCAPQAENGAPLSDANLGDQDTIAALDDLYDAAVANGETSVVTYGPGEDRYKPAYAEFMRRYPDIQVLPEYTYGADLSTRLDQEFGSGNHVASMVNGGTNITLLTNNSGRCDPYEPFTAKDLDPSLVGPNHSFNGITRWVFGFAYNPELVDAADVPTSWQDLTNPEWKGKLALTDPTTVNDASVSIAAMLYSGEYDETWLRELAANQPTILANSQLGIQSVAGGQQSIASILSYNSMKRLEEKNLPIAFVAPERGARLETHYNCLLVDDPAPSASKLLLNWMLTDEGQRALSDTGNYSVYPDISAPDGLPPADVAIESAMAEIPLDQYRAETTKTIELTKGIFR
ncbi:MULTISPECIES: ABC transporter substrate-binding protein [unclassified Rhodococcus (in: high G+C Gram-positive bacteria)]|uniref:ABC transporter substrate-binding protein n=1 Tax=unclassified Rhodococcus (in: high G+C Gram-positive bacteria) TaxID=192944 RepID=UPI0015954749|nr:MULTISPECIES: extracellular solute-binding protein [unclassified Rhodococcus (in: high G+C Gram-positive bacteria)]